MGLYARAIAEVIIPIMAEFQIVRTEVRFWSRRSRELDSRLPSIIDAAWDGKDDQEPLWVSGEVRGLLDFQNVLVLPSRRPFVAFGPPLFSLELKGNGGHSLCDCNAQP